MSVNPTQRQECICCGELSHGLSLCKSCVRGSGDVTTIKYKATPTGRRFHASTKRIRLLMGPVGSGKSVAGCFEIFTKAAKQAPGPDGVRRTRWAIIRNTYPELKSTTIKTWLDWFPEEHFGPIRWDIPITHHVRFNDISMEVIFLALDRPRDVKKLLSLEVTGLFFNEVREIEEEMIEAGDMRHGRYPSKRDGGPTWHGMIMDTNYPDDAHWIYRIAEESGEDVTDTWEIFKQPPGLIKVGPGEYVPNPDAENIDNLPDGYYIKAIPGKREAWILVYIMCQYATIVDGKPVYPEYNDAIHSANGNLIPNKMQVMMMGWDFGLNPSVIFFQISPRGQIRVLDEIVGDGMGLRQLIDNCVIPHIANNYPGYRFKGWGDPAGVARAETDEQTCFQILDEYNFPIEPAPGNNRLQRRTDGVARYLTKLVDGIPALVVSAKCKLLRRGFRGAYRYRRMQVAGEAKYQLLPEKNLVSHPHDAFQYGVLGATEPLNQVAHDQVAVRPVKKTTRAGY